MQYSKEDRFQCVEWFIEEGKDVASFQIRYRREMRHINHRGKAPDAKSIKAWYAKSKQGEGTKNKKRIGTKVFLCFLFLLRFLFSTCERQQKQPKSFSFLKRCLMRAFVGLQTWKECHQEDRFREF